MMVTHEMGFMGYIFSLLGTPTFQSACRLENRRTQGNNPRNGIRGLHFFFILNGPRLEFIRVLGYGKGGIEGYLLLLQEAFEVHIEGAHAILRPRFECSNNLVRLALAYHAAHAVSRGENLDCHDTSPTHLFCSRKKRLRHDSLEGVGKLSAYLPLLAGGEDIDDAVNRTGSGRSVQGGKYEVAGFSGGKRRGDGFKVAHLAQKDYIGVLAQRRAKRTLETYRIRADLALAYHRDFARVLILNGVLDGDDVYRFIFIDMV